MVYIIRTLLRRQTIMPEDRSLLTVVKLKFYQGNAKPLAVSNYVINYRQPFFLSMSITAL